MCGMGGVLKAVCTYTYIHIYTCAYITYRYLVYLSNYGCCCCLFLLLHYQLQLLLLLFATVGVAVDIFSPFTQYFLHVRSHTAQLSFVCILLGAL